MRPFYRLTDAINIPLFFSFPGMIVMGHPLTAIGMLLIPIVKNMAMITRTSEKQLLKLVVFAVADRLERVKRP